ncbi:MAG TPA: ABC transporter permease [Pyrinomonadaceae bacterium]|nr:ABC transporter permease [Pyrinomonadaceae bacterium]
METLIKDIRYGIRSLVKRPGFTAIAVITLAVGIGANTAVFSIVNAILFRPRAVAEPERLVELYVGHARSPYETSTYQDFLIFREQQEIFAGLAAYHIEQFKLGGAEDVEQVIGEVVSGNYFEVLGINAIKGRTFLPEEDQTPGTHPVAVISHGFWQRRFGANPAVIGQTITLNHKSLTVIGIAPPQYTGMLRGLAIEVWVPLMMMPQMRPESGMAFLNGRNSSWLSMVGRLRPGATLKEARARFDLVSRQLQDTVPEYWREKREGSNELREKFVTVLPESETRILPDAHSSVYAGIALILAMINLVLLIACMNLAGLLLARAWERRREIAVRLALGAGRGRIVRQLLTESVLLALVAGVAGTLLAMWLTNLLVAFIPALPGGIRLAIDLGIDWRVLAYTFGFSFLVGVFFGLVPALQISRPDVITALKEGSQVATGGYAQSRLRSGLIVAQVSFALVLLVGAGLAMRSLQNISPTRLGFDSGNLVVAPLELEKQYDRARSQEFYRQLEERTLALPGVQSVSFIDELPGGLLGRSNTEVGIEGYQQRTAIDSNTIGAGYLTAMKIPIVQGRDFNERDRDGAPCVAVVNETFVRRYFADGIALGKHLTKVRWKKADESCEIVGVVRDNKFQSLQKEPFPWFAFPLQQSYEQGMTMLVHSAGDPASIVPAVRHAIRSLDPNIPVADVGTLNDAFKLVLYLYGLFGMVVGACGGVAVLLASLGIYGTIAYGVGQRTREIGIRVALGANRQDILRLVIRQGMVRVIYGLTIGLLLALVLTRVLASSVFDVDLLYGVSASDPLTYVLVGALLILVTLLACYLPARRATKVDPLVALRYE